MMFSALFYFLFPAKCVLCRRLLTKQETDLCHHCRAHAPEVSDTKRKIPFIAQWTAMWYYKDDVRNSIHRFKFGNARFYADVYARLLALKVLDAPFADSFDLLTWVPTSTLRRLRRGYDQSSLLAHALGRELGVHPTRIIRRIRHTQPQSSLSDASHRRANIQGVYKIPHPESLAGKRILLIDDVLTTGATASECAKAMLTAGAKEVFLATVTATTHEKIKQCR